ncbi:TPA: hypothetical protein N2D99_002129 [Clostridium botulinum]|nr:hypothetical protein [Clostridium botulinum]
MSIEKILIYAGKAIKYLSCLLLAVWCLSAFVYNFVIAKEYFLSLIWLCGLSLPIALLLK